MYPSKQPRRAASRPRSQLPFFIVLGVGLLLAAVAILILFRNEDDDSGNVSFDAEFTPQTTGAPDMVVSEEVFDYGTLQMNTPVETVIRVRNVGDQTLYIFDEPQVELVQGC